MEHEAIHEAEDDDLPTWRVAEVARELVETNRLDLAALLWTACVLLASVGAATPAFRAQTAVFTFDGWDRIAYLANSMGLASVGMLVIGAGVAVWARGPVTRWVLRLVLVGGIWAVAASVLTIATVWHTFDQGGDSGVSVANPTIVGTLLGLALFGLGAVVCVVTGVVLSRLGVDGGDTEDDDDENAPIEVSS